jgi:hypothetical protein
MVVGLSKSLVKESLDAETVRRIFLACPFKAAKLSSQKVKSFGTTFVKLADPARPEMQEFSTCIPFPTTLYVALLCM